MRTIYMHGRVTESGDKSLGKTKRITANIPESFLKEAVAASGASLTETLIQGLKLVKRSAAYKKAQALKGKLDLEINLDGH